MAPDPAIVEPGSSIQETQFAAVPNEREVKLGSNHGTCPDGQTSFTDLNGEAHDEHNSTSVNDASYGATNGAVKGSAAGMDTKKSVPSAALSARSLAPDLLRGLLMVLQAIDHCSVSQGAWSHGVALESEADGTIVNTWNNPLAWTARTLTHLCAPGFMFLLGMGVVYFGRSRAKLGWTSLQMAKHFAIRAFVLAVVNEFFTLLVGQGRFVVLNIILLALAVNYLLAGLLWLVINASESLLASLLTFRNDRCSFDEDDMERPLLGCSTKSSTVHPTSPWASKASWHAHNALLLTLVVVTIAWNHWLSPHHGRCTHTMPPDYSGPTFPTGTRLGPVFDFWFIPIMTKMVISPFPPLGWLSAAILGILYGRIILARTWKSYTITASNMLLGAFLMGLFVLTRTLNFGNLTEDCLRMPEQLASTEKNQYLASFRSFFYVSKYPPSFAFLTFTMSIIFFLLGFFGALPDKVARRIPTLLTFGESALFFYVVHLLIYGGLGSLAKTWFGHNLGYTEPSTGKEAVGTSDNPAIVWITLLIGLAILYPLCRRYSRFKSTKGPNSVWRFF